MDKFKVLEELVRMSLNLGRPELDYVILGEGNTSARVNEDSFYVKASGAYLSGSKPEIFVEVKAAPVLELLDGPDLLDEDIKDCLNAARVDKSAPRPSVETTFHAFLLTLPGVNYVGHTHPTAVNAILCSNSAESIIRGRIFPDEIVYCGIRPAYLPYVDPGLVLARELRRVVQDYIATEKIPPKVILMQNHGLIALGSSPAEVENITAMWVKTARVLIQAYSMGGVHYLEEEHVNRIYTRPDEHYRRQYKGS